LRNSVISRPRDLAAEAAADAGRARSARASHDRHTILRYLSPEIDWEVLGIDEHWREEIRVVFRKRPVRDAGSGGLGFHCCFTAETRRAPREPFLGLLEKLRIRWKEKKRRNMHYCLNLACVLGVLGVSAVIRCSDPDALPQHHQLSEVIRIVIGHQQRFAQNCLPISPGDPGVEIDFGLATSCSMVRRSFLNAAILAFHAFSFGALPMPASILRAISGDLCFHCG
jgi:hypothetical protein